MTLKLYAYGIIDSPQSIDEPLEGLYGAPVYNIPYGDIGVVVSDLDPQAQVKTEESILKHEEVVEKLMVRFTVLPMSLSTVFNGKEELLVKVKKFHEDFVKNLERVRSKSEFGVKILWAGNTIKERIINAHKKENPSPDPALSGTKFMREKFAKYKIDKEFEEEADRCIAILDGFLNRIASEKKIEKLKTDNLLLSAAYLVDHEKRDDFETAFEVLRNSQGGDLKYLLSGPWPPYNFITLSHSEDGKLGGLDLVETLLKHEITGNER
ncbi:MAG: GvpL/GvpF family gas vesicle protein [Candidatus Omnitrophota bacterium]